MSENKPFLLALNIFCTVTTKMLYESVNSYWVSLRETL